MGYHRHCNRCNPINRLNEYIYYHNRLNRRIVRFKRSWDEIYKIIEEEKTVEKNKDAIVEQKSNSNTNIKENITDDQFFDDFFNDE